MPISKIHNIGFYELSPKSITCISYNDNSEKLAVARSNASIEIWNILNAPFIEKTISGSINGTIESLIWCEDRLFSCGLDGFIIEYDLYNLTVKNKVQVSPIAIWCMDINKSKTHLATGSENGYINIFQVEPETITFLKFLDKQEGRILCIKFDDTGDKIITGSVDTIRVWSVQTGHAIHKLNTGRNKDNHETIVWCIDIIDNETIVSGDSRGKISFWDIKQGALIESFPSHRADVLSLCVSKDKQTFHCAGVDPVITAFEKVNVKENHVKWVKSTQRHIHDHDVRNLLLVDKNLYSAGVDGYLAISNFPPKNVLRIPPLLQNPVVHLCPKIKCILLRYGTYLELWKLGSADDKEVGAGGEMSLGLLPINSDPKKLLVLKAKNDEIINACSISPNGNYIIYSTNTLIRIYLINFVSDSVELSRVNQIPDEIKTVHKIVFAPSNNEVILASSSGCLFIVELSQDTTDSILITQKISLNEILNDTMNFLTISECGQYLVASDCTGKIVVWSKLKKTRTKAQGKWNFYWQLPFYSNFPTAISIQPKLNNLIIAYADHTILEYNLKEQNLTDFSKKLNASPHKTWFHKLSAIQGIGYDPRAENIVILHNDKYLYIIDKNQGSSLSDKKIKRINSSELDISSSKTILHDEAVLALKKYKHLVYFGYFTEDELIAVEVTSTSLVAQLPPCIQFKKFGIM